MEKHVGRKKRMKEGSKEGREADTFETSGYFCLEQALAADEAVRLLVPLACLNVPGVAIV